MTITLDEAYLLRVLSAIMLEDPTPEYVFDEFVQKKFEFNKREGDTIQLNRWTYLGDTGLTLEQRSLTKQQTIGTGNALTLKPEKVDLILQEIGGPYNDTYNKVAPLAMHEKDILYAQQNLTNFDTPKELSDSLSGDYLKDDAERLHDRILCNLFLQATNTRNPDGVDDGSTAITGTGSTLTSDDVLYMKETLATSNVKAFQDGNYVAIISPRMERHLLSDEKFLKAMQYGRPDSIYRGEIGVYEGFRFVRSSNIPTATINSLTAHQGVFFGRNAVGYGQGMMTEVRKNSNDDYGRFLFCVWLTYRAYAVLNEKFIVKARTYAQ